MFSYLGCLVSEGIQGTSNIVGSLLYSSSDEGFVEKPLVMTKEIEKLQTAYYRDRLVVDPMLLVFNLAMVSLKHQLALLEIEMEMRVGPPRIKMLILEESGQISSAPQGFDQSAVRFLASPMRTNKRKQLEIIYKHIIKALKWFPANQITSDDNLSLRLIYKHAMLGLMAIKNTYEDPKASIQDPIVRHLDLSIETIQQFLNCYNGFPRQRSSSVSFKSVSRQSMSYDEGALSEASMHSARSSVDSDSLLSSPGISMGHRLSLESSSAVSTPRGSVSSCSMRSELPGIVQGSDYTLRIKEINDKEFPLSEVPFQVTYFNTMHRDQFIANTVIENWKNEFDGIAEIIKSIDRNISSSRENVGLSKKKNVEFKTVEAFVKTLPRQFKGVKDKIQGLELIYQGYYELFLPIKKKMLEVDENHIVDEQKIKSSPGMSSSLSSRPLLSHLPIAHAAGKIDDDYEGFH